MIASFKILRSISRISETSTTTTPEKERNETNNVRESAAPLNMFPAIGRNHSSMLAAQMKKCTEPTIAHVSSWDQTLKV